MAEKGVLPRRYRPGFIVDLDGRTALPQRLTANLAALEADLGGPDELSTAQRTLAERSVWLGEVLRQHENRMANGQAIDLGSYVRGIQTLTTLLKTLGLKRRSRTVGLGDILRAGDP
jgi:hypothetical protein